MKLKHRISINVCEADGGKTNVIKGGEVKLREKLLRWLFGEKKKVLVIAPGDSVFNVEIREQDLGKLFDEYLDEALEGKTDAEKTNGAAAGDGAATDDDAAVNDGAQAAAMYNDPIITAEKEVGTHEAVSEC